MSNFSAIFWYFIVICFIFFNSTSFFHFILVSATACLLIKVFIFKKPKKQIQFNDSSDLSSSKPNQTNNQSLGDKFFSIAKIKFSTTSKVVVIIYCIYCLLDIKNAINQIGFFPFLGLVLFGCVFLAGICEFFHTFMHIKRKKKKKIILPDIKPEEFLITTIKTKVVGVTFRCALNDYKKRQEVLECLSEKSPLHLEPYTYQGEPANYVVWKNTDIGCLKTTLSKELYKKYPDCRYDVSILQLTGYEPDNKFLGCNIEIKIYK